MVTIRPATPADADALLQALTFAADWRPGSTPRPPASMLDEPAFAHYVEGWPRPGDLGVVAEDHDGVPLGAAWCRFLPPEDRGYGWVGPDVPELSIGLTPTARGVGVGRRMLEALIDQVWEHGIGQLSLSVELDNTAMHLYRRVGFRVVAEADGAATMVLDVAAGPGAADAATP